MARKPLGQVLKEAGLLTEEQVRAALREQQRWGGPLGEVLVTMGLLSEESLVAALSQQLRIPRVQLKWVQIPEYVLRMVPAELAVQHHIIPFREEGSFLDIAMADPMNEGVIEEIRMRARRSVRPHFASAREIFEAIEKCYTSLANTSEPLGWSSGWRVLEPTTDGQGLRQPESAGPRATTAPSARQPAASPGAVSGQGRASTAPAAGQRVPTPPPAAQRAQAAAPVAQQRAPHTVSAQRVTRTNTPVPGVLDAVDLVPPAPTERAREIHALQARVQRLEALVARDEEVLRRLIALLVERDLVTRDEIIARLG